MNHRQMRQAGVGAASIVLAAGVAAAQPPPGGHDVDITVSSGQAGTAMWVQAEPMPPGDFTFEIVAPPLGVGGDAVTGAPYSAEAITEMVQTLADGNRIVRQTSMQIFRDSAGRTRREGGLALVGPLVGSADEPRLVSIHDPRAGVSYVLDPATHTAKKMTPPRLVRADAAGAAKVEGPGQPVEAPPHVVYRFERSVARLPEPKVEQLGSRSVEGVMAEGTRSTVTIPAGHLGNEQPIAIVSERWYSPELQVIVQSRRSDPRFGDTVYRLTRIVRAEPAPGLFEVPPDYRVVDGVGPDVLIQRKILKSRP